MHIPDDIKEALVEQGYSPSRGGVNAYIEDMAEAYGVSYQKAYSLAEVVGIDELFDAFVTYLEDDF